MNRYRVVMVLDVDPEELALHVEKSKGEKPPYVVEVEEWDGSDFFRAADELIIDSGEVELVSVELVEKGVGEDA
jgi:hypothetical protein